MKQVIIDLKQRIEDNYKALHDESSDSSRLTTSILEMINLFLSTNASDEQIKLYLKKIESAIKLIEEKLERVEKREKI